MFTPWVWSILLVHVLSRFYFTNLRLNPTAEQWLCIGVYGDWPQHRSCYLLVTSHPEVGQVLVFYMTVDNCPS